MEIYIRRTKICKLCHKHESVHCGGDYDESACYEILRQLASFLTEYNRGLYDLATFDVTVRVKNGEITYVGSRKS